MNKSEHKIPRGANMLVRAALVLASMTSVGCVSHMSTYVVPSRTFVLAETESEDGSSSEYVVYPGGSSQPAVQRTVNRVLDLPYLGISPASMNAEYAKSLDAEPWKGVLLEEVVENSPAKAAGLSTGDILLEADGVVFASKPQCLEWIANGTEPGQELEVVYMRRDPEGWLELRSALTVGSREVIETASDRTALKMPELVENRTGLEVGTLPVDIVREIWDEDRTYVIVTHVVSGSPAYQAGLRRSDRILACNGVEVSTGDDLDREIKRGATTLELDVDGPLGRHRARVETTSDMGKRSRIHIPFIYRHSSSIARSSTKFLDVIFQFGFTKKHRWLDSATRRPAESSSISILPLGMFEFERGPNRSRNTIFWLISWSTDS